MCINPHVEHFDCKASASRTLSEGKHDDDGSEGIAFFDPVTPSNLADFAVFLCGWGGMKTLGCLQGGWVLAAAQLAVGCDPKRLAADHWVHFQNTLNPRGLCLFFRTVLSFRTSQELPTSLPWVSQSALFAEGEPNNEVGEPYRPQSTRKFSTAHPQAIRRRLLWGGVH